MKGTKMKLALEINTPFKWKPLVIKRVSSDSYTWGWFTITLVKVDFIKKVPNDDFSDGMIITNSSKQESINKSLTK